MGDLLSGKLLSVNLAAMSDTSPPAAPVLLTQIDNGIATLTLNRPAVRNALNLDLLAALEEAVENCRTNRSIRAIILTGAGDGFMAGGDIRHFGELITQTNYADTFGRMLDRVNRLIQHMRELPQPIIAAVNGACAGFGVSLMLAADLAISTESANFTIAYDRLALTPDGGASWHLVRMLGQRRASEWLLTGQTLPAAKAEQWGLLNKIVPPEQLMPTAHALAAQLCKASAPTLARTKTLINTAADNLLSHQLDGEAESFVALTQKPDFAEGVRAFMEKRPPNFTGDL